MLKTKSLEKFYNKNIVKDRQTLGSSSNSKAKEVLLLFEEDELLEKTIKEVSKILQVPLKNITTLGYKNSEKNKEVLENYFTNKDIGYRAKIKSQELKSKIEKPYDILISYCQEPTLYSKLVVLLSQSKFKISFAEIDDRLFDLVISEPNFNTTVFHQEIKKYLTILQKI